MVKWPYAQCLPCACALFLLRSGSGEKGAGNGTTLYYTILYYTIPYHTMIYYTILRYNNNMSIHNATIMIMLILMLIRYCYHYTTYILELTPAVTLNSEGPFRATHLSNTTCLTHVCLNWGLYITRGSHLSNTHYLSNAYVLQKWRTMRIAQYLVVILDTANNTYNEWGRVRQVALGK